MEAPLDLASALTELDLNEVVMLTNKAVLLTSFDRRCLGSVTLLSASSPPPPPKNSLACDVGGTRVPDQM